MCDDSGDLMATTLLHPINWVSFFTANFFLHLNHTYSLNWHLCIFQTIHTLLANGMAQLSSTIAFGFSQSIRYNCFFVVESDYFFTRFILFFLFSLVSSPFKFIFSVSFFRFVLNFIYSVYKNIWKKQIVSFETGKKIVHKNFNNNLELTSAVFFLSFSVNFVQSMLGTDRDRDSIKCLFGSNDK